jgi:hypothetical protein
LLGTRAEVTAMKALPIGLAAALGVWVLGCTSWKLDEPRVAPSFVAQPLPPNAALVCLERTSALAQAVTFPTHDDGILVGATRGPGHFCYLAEAGEHVITMEADEVETAKLTAVAGQRYFLEQQVDFLFGYVKCRATWVAEPEARQPLDDTPYEVLVGVPGTERLPAAAPFAPAMHAPIAKP